MKEYVVLGIESSCDETAAAVYTTNQGLLSNEIYSQIKLHVPHGVVHKMMSTKQIL